MSDLYLQEMVTYETLNNVFLGFKSPFWLFFLFFFLHNYRIFFFNNFCFFWSFFVFDNV